MARQPSAIIGRTAATNREAARQLRMRIKEEKTKASAQRKAVTAARAAHKTAEREFTRAQRTLAKQLGAITKLEAKLPQQRTTDSAEAA